ncbi:uncharacterized protein LOC143470933 [Clavelina lepadiformis]|uniref:uncharacterized protein LOC143470933 n=1 Tax=Clavelina lepadiformis TaxID=159417 RepID=UPI004041D3ED
MGESYSIEEADYDAVTYEDSSGGKNLILKLPRGRFEGGKRGLKDFRKRREVERSKQIEFLEKHLENERKTEDERYVVEYNTEENTFVDSNGRTATLKIAGGKFEGRKEEAREFQARIEAERKTQREILEKHLEEERIVKKERHTVQINSEEDVFEDVTGKRMTLKLAGGKYEGSKEEANHFQIRIENERKNQREFLQKYLELQQEFIEITIDPVTVCGPNRQQISFGGGHFKGHKSGLEKFMNDIEQKQEQALARFNTKEDAKELNELNGSRRRPLPVGKNRWKL